MNGAEQYEIKKTKKRYGVGSSLEDFESEFEIAFVWCLTTKSSLIAFLTLDTGSVYNRVSLTLGLSRVIYREIKEQ